jgi:hypothetical protein
MASYQLPLIHVVCMYVCVVGTSFCSTTTRTLCPTFSAIFTGELWRSLHSLHPRPTETEGPSGIHTRGSRGQVWEHNDS